MDINNTIVSNQLIYVSLATIITTIFSQIVSQFVTKIFNNFGTLCSFVFENVLNIWNKYIVRKLNHCNRIFIQVYDIEIYGSLMNPMNVSKNALPIIWYLKQNPEILRNIKLEFSQARSNQRDNEKIQHDQNDLKSFNIIPYFLRKIISTQNSTTSENTNMSYELKDNIIKLTDEILLEITYENGSTKTIFQRDPPQLEIFFVIKSDKKTIPELLNFLDDIRTKYIENIMKENSNGKIFIASKLVNNLFSYTQYNIDKSQIFDNLFFQDKNKIMSKIDKLADKEYYTKHSIKRKLSYLFIGNSGSGKTCTVTAIANRLNRTIVYIPLSRITKNKELEILFYNRTYEDVKLTNDNVILFFDEIDSFGKKKLMKNTESSDVDTNTTKNAMPNLNVIIQNDSKQQTTQCLNNKDDDSDDINIGVFLSLLDGSIDQDGLIIIATANNVDKIDPAMFRDGRFQIVKFDYVGRSEIKNMIEYYYQTKIDDSITETIRNDRTIQTLSIKNLCIECLEDNIPISELVEKINNL